MSMRAKFVRWLGIVLGVMEPIKEKPMEQQQGFTQDQINTIVGAKEMEIISLRMQLGAALKRIAELEPPQTKTILKEVTKEN